MQKRRSFFDNEMEQRFGLRKYTIGLCSVCLGFVTIGIGSQTVKADTVNDVENSSVVQENKMQDTDPANTTVSTEAMANTADSATAKPNITPTETKENETGSVATTAPKTNSASNGVKINTADSAISTETKPTKENSTVANSNNALAQAKSTKAESIVQPKVNGTSTETKPNELGSAAVNPNAVSTEAKLNTADPASLAKIKPQKIRLAKLVNAKALAESKVATDNQFNFDDWNTQIDNNYLNITGYKGDRSKQIVVPNGADFAKAGKNDKNLQVEIDKNTLADLIVDGVAPKLSNTDGQKIVAKGSDWFYAFYDKHLHDISGLANLDTSNVTNMGCMFEHNQISDLSPLANWNTGKVTRMHYMFDHNQISDLSPLANWNTGNVYDMHYMFDHNQISDLSLLANWNTGKVIDMSYMFNVNQISDLSPLANWNTSNVYDMKYMFDYNQISNLSPLANWNTGKVTDMRNMFDHNQISDLRPLAGWNTGKVTNMERMFYENQISDLSPLANWNTDKVTDMSYMFANNRISDLSLLANWNTGNVTDMGYMFYKNQISDLSPLANWNTGNVTNMGSMFKRNQISDLSPLANWNTGNVTDMGYMFYYNPLNSTINSQSTLNKFHAIAYKVDNTGALTSHSESKTFNDGLQVLLDKNVVTTVDSATLTFKANSSAGNTYQIKIYNPYDSINIQAEPLQTALGITDTSYQDGYTIITNKFINNGSVTQRIYIRPTNYYNFAQYQSTSGLITVVKDKEDLGSINITYQNVFDISNYINAPYIGDKPYINHTQNTFDFQPGIDGGISYKSAGLTITVPDDVTIDPDTFIDVATRKTLKATKIADNQYYVELDNSTDWISVKGLINVPADKFTNGTVHYLPGFGMKYTINTYNDKVAPLVATGTSNELSIIPDLASYHGDLIKIRQSKYAFDRNGNEVSNYASQGFNNASYTTFELAVSTQVTNGVVTFDIPTGVNITEFSPHIYCYDHIDYIFTDGSKQTTSDIINKTPKAIRQMKVYLNNGIRSASLYSNGLYFSVSSFDATYPDGTPIKNFDIFKITGSFSCDELGSTGNVDVAQIMLAPTQTLTDGMLTDTRQNESNTAPNANGNFIGATIICNNDDLQYQGHLTNPIFYFKYNDLMVPDLSKISASYDNQNKELGSIGLTNIDNNKIHSSIITDSTGQKFIKVQVDGEYYYGGSSDFNVHIPIINAPDALTATKDWSWYILNNSDEEKTKSTIRNSSQSNKLDPVTVDGNTLSVGGTGTWQIIVAQGLSSSTETQGNLNGGPGLASTQDDHQQDPTHFYIYDSIINATNDAKSDLVSVVNLPSTQDDKNQFDVHMTGKASLINVMTGQTYDATITYSYGTGNNNFITSDQVKDWSKVKSIKVVPNGGAPSMTSLRLVVPVEDKHVYEHVGKTIYMSTMTYGEDKTNTKYTTKDGFAVPEKSTILPIIIKPGDRASAKLTVKGQATVHTLIHYKDTNGKDVYVKLADQDKTYNELQDTMKRSDYLQSDRDLTMADRGLLPTGMVINYTNPTIRNSNNTYAAGYANNVAAFDKTAKYDFDGDQVIFEGAMPEVVTQTHQVKETIHYVYSDGSPAAPDKVLTSVALKQTSYKNPFTGEITWNASTTDTLNSVDSPEITGYTPDKSSIERQTFKFGDKDVEVTVTYSANAQTATITYIDDTEKKTLGSDKQNGKFNQVITFEHDPAEVIKGLEEKGYKLVSNDFKSGIKYQNDNKFNNFEVHLKHGTENVSRNDDVNMTVHYVMDDGSEAPNDNKQTVNFTENGTQDLVTKDITWTPADSQTLKDVDSPVLIGYTADIKTASGKVVNFDDPDINVTVHYSANAQAATITYIDDTEKKTLGSDKQNGKFNQVITFEHDLAEVIKGLEEKGYKLVSNDFKSGIKYQNDNKFNNFEVHLKHGTENVSRNDDVNMTVHYVMDDGSEAPNDNKQTVNFTENGTQDLVTKDITWTPADSQTLKDVDSPVLIGYTADIKTASGKVVNFDDPDINVTVHYSANEQTATITYIDDTTKTNLDSKVANGKFNQAITFETAPTDEIANYEKQGYKLVSNDFNNQKYQADNNNNVFYVHLKHKTEGVTRNGTVTRTIHYLYDNDNTAQPDKTQTVSFNETGTKDYVTGKTTWNNDNAQTVDSVITPSIAGYTPDKSSIEGQAFKFGDKDVEVTVTYSANAQTATITYIDDTTKTNLDSKVANGKFGQAITFETAPTDEIAKYEKQGYILVSNSFNNQTYDADNSNNVFYVHLKHGTTTVTPDNPGHPGEPVDPKNSEGPKYPNGTELDQVKRTGTQTIHYVGAGDNTPADNTQTFVFTRKITFDNVTGKITKVTSWNVESHTFGNVDTPVIPGYHADKAVAGGATVTPDDLNKVIIVTYAPDGGSDDNPGSNGGGDQDTTPTPEPVPEPTPSPDDQPDTTLPSDNNTDKDVEKDKQDKPEEMKKARKIIKTRITKQEHIGNAEKAEHLTEQKHNDQTVVSPVKNEANEPQLPQTGEANTSVIGLLGMLVAGFAEILGFESSRSRKHKN